ncbi:proteasome assembly chaperone family protein [Candidatus Micrarchaeota archaeon]|nr:proteasome assembly chaperone family protein [Candidatus Micrarchaeota archaeon]
MAVKIIETSKFDLKNPILIEGFPGIGLVGTISANYLVEKLKMEPLGYITSEKFPPFSAVHNYQPMHPARIYKSKKHNIVVILSEFIVPLSTVHDLSTKIMEWSKQRKIKEIITLGGISIQGEQDTVYGIASTPKLAKHVEKNGKVSLIREGATTGISGILLADCAAISFPALSLLAESKPDYLDPRAASMVLEALKGITGIKFDTRELIKEEKAIQTKLKEVMDKAKNASEHYKKVEELGPMYG